MRGMRCSAQPTTYLDGIDILSFHRQLAPGPDGSIHGVSSFDIVANGVGVRPAPDADPFVARLNQGVMDTNAEALLIATPPAADSAANTLALAAAQGIELKAVRSDNDPAWRAMDLPADVRQRMSADLSSGAAILLPAKAPVQDGRPHYAWWRLDPATGQVLGIGPSGWGQAAAEESMVKSHLELAIVTLASVDYLMCIGSIPNNVTNAQAGARAFSCMAGYGLGAGLAGVEAAPTAVWPGILELVKWIREKLDLVNEKTGWPYGKPAESGKRE
jgi:hypothetical protein